MLWLKKEKEVSCLSECENVAYYIPLLEIHSMCEQNKGYGMHSFWKPV